MPKCPMCELEVKKEEAIHDEASLKYYHKKCYQEYNDRKELFDYICALFDFKTPGPKIYSQVKNFRAKGISYKEMLIALKYHYEIKNGDKTKSNGGIGIVPYVVEEAKSYLSAKQYYDRQLVEHFLSSKKEEKEEVVRITQLPNGKKKKNFIDIDNL